MRLMALLLLGYVLTTLVLAILTLSQTLVLFVLTMQPIPLMPTLGLLLSASWSLARSLGFLVVLHAVRGLTLTRQVARLTFTSALV